MGEIAERFMRHAANVDPRRYNVRELVDVSQFDAEKRSLYAAIAELESISDVSRALRSSVIEGDVRRLYEADARAIAAEARAERAERDNAMLHGPQFAGRRLILGFSPAEEVPLGARHSFAVKTEDGEVVAEVANRSERHRTLSVAVFELDDTALDTLERRATELIAAGEALLAEYGKRKAAEEAATSEVLR